ncbi:hypothetical protein Ptr86124_014231, partial [Pyrenophora tritici-repentis]
PEYHGGSSGLLASCVRLELEKQYGSEMRRRKLQKARSKKQREEARLQRQDELEERRVERQRLKEMRELERAEKAAERARQKERETLLKLYNYPKRERGELQQLPHRTTSVKNALRLLALVLKFKKSLQLLHQSSHHRTPTFKEFGTLIKLYDFYIILTARRPVTTSAK